VVSALSPYSIREHFFSDCLKFLFCEVPAAFSQRHMGVSTQTINDVRPQ